MNDKQEYRVRQLYQEYLDRCNKANKSIQGSGCFHWAEDYEMFRYRFTWGYKIKNSWIVKRFNRFIYRLKCIWWAITDLDRLDENNY